MNKKYFKIGKKYIGNNKKTFIIAEIGINHGGKFTTCKKMIKAAARSGADSVKIQTINVDESYMPNTLSYRQFKNKNFSNKQLLELKRYSKKLNVIFFSTPGDIKSLKKLIKIKVPAIKISSGLATNLPLIGSAIKSMIPVIISTGLSLKQDLSVLKKFIKKYKNKKIAILKCTSQYPAPAENLNLNSIDYLQKKFELPVGFSDHTIGDHAAVVAVSKGAKIIEKHFTLNKFKKGADHHISLEPKEFKTMVNKIRLTEKMLGKKTLVVDRKIKNKRKKYLRYITAKKEIKKGETFSFENIGFLRHTKIKQGLEPKFFFSLENKKSKTRIRKNQIFRKKHL